MRWFLDSLCGRVCSVITCFYIPKLDCAILKSQICPFSPHPSSAHQLRSLIPIDLPPPLYHPTDLTYAPYTMPFALTTQSSYTYTLRNWLPTLRHGASTTIKQSLNRDSPHGIEATTAPHHSDMHLSKSPGPKNNLVHSDTNTLIHSSSTPLKRRERKFGTRIDTQESRSFESCISCSSIHFIRRDLG